MQISDISKFLSYVLRHRPDAIGIAPDREGWVEITALIAAAAKAGRQLDADLIRTVVETNDKKRFSFSEDGLRIRAAQGHSSKSVNISYSEKEPPDFLYHGTATRFMESIGKEGLRPGLRHYVHLSPDKQTATTVGRRHGKPVVLTVAAHAMHEQGYRFFQADNGVWLTEKIPPEFLAV
jgi:putative RNA 2'-phosphotransferase